MSELPQLLTFAISHFSEKTRWSLERAGVAFRETKLEPVFHIWAVRRVAPRTSVPVLIHGDHVIQGSSEILDYAAEHLDGRGLQLDAAGQELDRYCVTELGRPLQSVYYAGLLAVPGETARWWYRESGAVRRWVGGAIVPLVAGTLRRTYTTDPDSVTQAKQQITAACDRLELLLERSPYLAGAEPGRLDFSVAGLLAHLVRPSEHPYPWLPLPATLVGYADEMSKRPLLAWVRRLYQQYRRTDSALLNAS